MKIDPRNIEHYADPTCYQALVSISKKEAKKKRKPVVYICSPYAGDVKTNVANARKYCRFAYKKNAIPIAPHLLYPQFLDDSDQKERRDGLFMGLVLLTKCRELWVFGGNISSGMQSEIQKATKRGMTIRYFTDDLKEVKK